MLNAKYFLLFGILSTFEISYQEEQTSRSGCAECDQSACEPPQGCLAGMVKDSCDCCYLCGGKEGQLCDHADLDSDEAYGTCGDNLECRIRTDLAPGDPQEATCVCTQPQPLCGSDGVTYDNICQITEARYRRRDGLRPISREPCRTAPAIVTAPSSQRNRTGSYVAMLCEAVGWPVPVIKWKAYKSNDEPVVLPGTSSRIVVHSRSGSGYGDVTSWLLITHLLVEDDATYQCVADNDMGSASASADVYVIP